MQVRRQSGGEIVARTLTSIGVDTVFTVSGNQILPVFDAAFDARLRMVHMRHETAAVYAAIGAAELHRRVAVALVSAGPGFLASLQGLGIANSMELPVILMAGAAPITQRHRGAFQDIDQRAIAAPICKSAFEPSNMASINATILDAASLATNGVPGPVFVSLPADLLSSTIDPRAALDEPATSTWEFDEAVIDSLIEMSERLQSAQRPVIIARPSASRSEWLPKLAELLGIRPIITESPRGLSDPRYSDAFPHIRESDCVLVVAGADFSTGFLDAARVGDLQNVVLIDAEGDPQPAATPALRCRVSPDIALRYLCGRVQPSATVDPGWARVLAVKPPPPAPLDDPDDGIHPLAVAETIRSVISPDDVVVLDGGEFCQWIRLGLRDITNVMPWNGKLGAIGGSIPMALGAAVTAPERRVIAVLGDGSAGYFLSEFETLTRYGIRITALIGNDARWAAEWHMQAARYGADRTFDTDLTPARYDLAAQGFGASGINVTRRADLQPALVSALAASSSTCINVTVAAARSPAEVLH